MRELLLITLALAMLSSSCLALKVFPTLTDLGDTYAEEQSFILTVLNDDAGTARVHLDIDHESSYLKPYVRIEPEDFTLKSNSKKNVQITTSFPGNLSPERHRLVIIPTTDDGIGEKAVYTFEVEGIARPDLRVTGLSLEGEDSKTFRIELNNLGNVIARATPEIVIRNNSEIIDRVAYESRIMVMPFSKANITLLYDPSDLAEGRYQASAAFSYNDNLKTNELKKEFVVEKQRQRPSSGALGRIFSKIKYPSFVIIAVMLLILAIRPEYLKIIYPRFMSETKYSKDTIARVSSLEKKISQVERETEDLANQAQAFIYEANSWLKNRYGDRYQFN